MGFGLILAGLCSLLFFRVFPMELVGFVAVAFGLNKLSGYQRTFRAAFASALTLVAFSAVDAVLWALRIAKVYTLSQEWEIALSAVHTLLLLPFFVFLLYAQYALCRELGFTKGARRAVFALVCVGVYYAVYAVSQFVGGSLRGVLAYASLLLFLLAFFAVEAAVFACYRMITTDEQTRAEDKKVEAFDKRFGRRKKDGNDPRKSKK